MNRHLLLLPIILSCMIILVSSSFPIDLAFSSKRKNIKNNLKKLDIDWDKENIDPTKRSEEVSLNNFINLAKEYLA